MVKVRSPVVSSWTIKVLTLTVNFVLSLLRGSQKYRHISLSI
nr:MAG TPA: hypothetical protein [Caudoviricetes sp.]